MLTLNKYQKTKDGESVFPVSVSGDVVQCFNTQGEVIFRNLNSFPEEPEKREREEQDFVEVSPVESKNTDQLHSEEEDQEDDGLREEEESEEESDDDEYVSDDNYI